MMIILTDELLDYFAEQYLANKYHTEKGITFEQYLESVLRKMKEEIYNG